MLSTGPFSVKMKCSSFSFHFLDGIIPFTAVLQQPKGGGCASIPAPAPVPVRVLIAPWRPRKRVLSDNSTGTRRKILIAPYFTRQDARYGRREEVETNETDERHRAFIARETEPRIQEEKEDKARKQHENKREEHETPFKFSFPSILPTTLIAIRLSILS